MKSKDMFVQVLAIILVLLMAVPPVSFAQDTGGPPPLKQEEVEQLVAPIALYPDSLMAQILMASTYPLEIVQAARWSKENKNLQGDKLEAELKKKDWDPSVKSLAAFPPVLAMMNDNLEWTQKMGNAFLTQQKEVMDAVQRLRGKAYVAGYLKTTKEQKVVVEKTAEVQIIKVEPVTQVVYVPTYNPTIVYGVWAYPAYPPPPVYPPGYVATTSAFAFVAGVAVGAAVYGGVNWGHNNSTVVINNNYNKANFNRATVNNSTWQHNPQHRKGAQYPNKATAQQYGQSGAARSQAQQNMGARGYGQAGTKAQPAAPQRGQQPAASQRPAQPAASQRPSQASAAQRPAQPSAFGGSGGGGMQERAASSRGQMSRSAGGFQGGGRGGGGGRRR